MVHTYDESHNCKSQLEKADSRLRNPTPSHSSVTNLMGATNLTRSEKLAVTFKEIVVGRSRVRGEVEVQGSDGSRIIWSCNRCKH